MADNPSPSLERMQQMILLESIFLPRTRKQRMSLYPGAKSDSLPTGDAFFVHYTSAEAALKIIRSKRLWMRNTNCMADFREVQHGVDLLNGFFTTERKERFCGAVALCAPNAAEEAINLFNNWWNDIRFNTFIASLSEHDSKKEDNCGRLSMWRGFGVGNVPRVALVLKVPAVSDAPGSLNLAFSPVMYLSQKETENTLLEVIGNVEKNRDLLRSLDRQLLVRFILHTLVSMAVCMKHQGFQEEREWRVVYLPELASSPLIQSSVETIGGVPQVVYQLPLDVTVNPVLADIDLPRVLHRLIIGPSPYPWAMHQAFSRALVDARVPDAGSRVWTSDIPIRP